MQLIIYYEMLINEDLHNFNKHETTHNVTQNEF